VGYDELGLSAAESDGGHYEGELKLVLGGGPSDSNTELEICDGPRKRMRGRYK